MSSDRLAGKVAIVTGGSRGMGAAIVRSFVREGANVLSLDLLDEGQAGAADGVRGGSALFMKADVSSPTDWDSVVARCRETFGDPDVLVNNAGILGSGKAVHEEELDEWDRTLDVNLKGVFLGMRAVIPGMLSLGRGAIVNTSSMWGLVAAADYAAYHASKGAVNILTKNVAITYAQRGIRANSIHPGMIDTPMNATMPPDAANWIIDRIPMHRQGTPDEVAATVVFLASDESAYITGASVPVDGGFVAM